MNSIQKLAETALNCFEVRTRDNGNTYYCRKDGSPEWIQDLVFNAHSDMMPDDYRYVFIHDALGIIQDYDDEDDYFEALDNSVDTYTSAVTNWLGSRNDRYSYVDQAIEEYGPFDSIITAISAGQSKEREEVFYSVLEFLKDLSDEEDDEE
jgi:hypothetical protein